MKRSSALILSLAGIGLIPPFSAEAQEPCTQEIIEELAV